MCGGQVGGAERRWAHQLEAMAAPTGRRWWCLGSGDDGRVAEKWMDFGDMWEVEIIELADE